MTVSTNERKKRKRKRVESSERGFSPLALDPLDTSSVDSNIQDLYFEKQGRNEQVCWLKGLNNMFGYGKFTATMFAEFATRMDSTSWKPWRDKMIEQFKESNKRAKIKDIKNYEDSLKLGHYGIKGLWCVNVIADFIEANTRFKLRRYGKSAKYPIHKDIVLSAVSCHLNVMVTLEWQQYGLHQSHVIAIKKTLNGSVVLDSLQNNPVNFESYNYLEHVSAIYYVTRR